MLKIGDEVVHQSHPGRFRVTMIEPRPHANVYDRVITIESSRGLELKLLESSVRKLQG
ncbi:MAG: hypothetical protein ACE5E4_07490 [Candidatus Binatia bacterium]